jgi:hypothetical protein
MANFKLSLRDLFWFVFVAALVCFWYVERRHSSLLRATNTQLSEQLKSEKAQHVDLIETAQVLCKMRGCRLIINSDEVMFQTKEEVEQNSKYDNSRKADEPK